MESVFTLVEYLVGGLVGFLWLIPVLHKLLPFCELDTSISGNEALISAITVAFAYVLGIFLDRASSFLLKPQKSINRTTKGLIKIWQRYTLCKNTSIADIKNKPKAARSKNSSQKFTAYDKTTKILVCGSDALAQATQVNVGRERIARMMLINSLVGLIVAVWLVRYSSALLILLIIVVIWSLLTWAELSTLSAQFKENAVAEVERKH